MPPELKGAGGGLAGDVVIPALAGLGALVAVRTLGLDALLTDAIYALEGGHWALRSHVITSGWLHIGGRRFMITIGVLTLAAVIAGYAGVPGLRRFRAGLSYVLATTLSALLLVSLSKHALPVPCPWDLSRYGGDVTGPGGLPGLVPGNGHSGCFPAGHAAGGYSLLTWYFFGRHYRLPGGAWWLLPGLGVGLVFSAAQELRGAHFLSHDIASVTFCWLFAAVSYHLTLGRRSSIHRESNKKLTK